jgi:hypothetical protein
MNRTNDDKLELFADVLEPAGRIIADKAWALKWQAGDRIGAIREAIKGHKADIVEILARIDGAEPAQYQIDGLALFMRLVTLFNRPDLEPMTGLFTSQAQNGDKESSGPATGNTGVGVK